MTFPTMILSDPSHANSKPMSTSTSQITPLRPFLKQTSTSGEKKTKINDMESFQENLILQGISNRVADLLSKCRRRETTLKYESVSGTVASCCGCDKLIHFVVI